MAFLEKNIILVLGSFPNKQTVIVKTLQHNQQQQKEKEKAGPFMETSQLPLSVRNRQRANRHCKKDGWQQEDTLGKRLAFYYTPKRRAIYLGLVERGYHGIHLRDMVEFASECLEHTLTREDVVFMWAVGLIAFDVAALMDRGPLVIAKPTDTATEIHVSRFNALICQDSLQDSFMTAAMSLLPTVCAEEKPKAATHTQTEGSPQEAGEVYNI